MTFSPAIYDAEQVREAASYADCIAVVRKAMADFSHNSADQPLRSIEHVPGGGMLGVMPGWLAGTPGFGTKIVTVFEDSDHPGRARHQGMVLLFNRPHGEVVCLADAETITELRTAAASAVATNLLARPDSTRLTIYGCGVQAEAHIRALLLVRPISEVTIWGRSCSTAQDLAEKMASETGVTIKAESDPVEAASTADVICTVTGSPTPILHGAWVKPGTHVNLVGSSHAGAVEVDTDLVKRGRFIADSRRSVMAAGAEFLIAKQEGAIGDDHIVGEIGEVIQGKVTGRSTASEITIYKSLGHIVQDLALAEHVHAAVAGAGRSNAEHSRK